MAKMDQMDSILMNIDKQSIGKIGALHNLPPMVKLPFEAICVLKVSNLRLIKQMYFKGLPGI